MTINETLTKDGWVQYPDPFRDPFKKLFAKKVPGHAPCNSNQGDKQICIEYYLPDRIAGIKLPESWSVVMHGALPNEEWIRMSIDQLNEIQAIYRCVDLLFLLWDQAVAKTPRIEKD